MSRKKRKSKQTNELCIAPLEDVLKSMGVTDNDWDALIVGDGSGSNWDKSCGWCCALIDKFSKERKLLYGAMSCGTVNISELMPYIHALAWYEEHHGNLVRHRGLENIRVHIITDSQLTANQGNRQVNRKANRQLWESINYFESINYRFHWHWAPRELIGLNVFSDDISRQARKFMDQVIFPENNTVDNINPN
jgi:ribonuclease HI